MPTEAEIAAAAAAAALKTETVSKSDYDKIVADAATAKAEAKALKDAAAATKTQQMKEQNQWKELAEAREAEATTAKAEAASLKNSFLSEKKYSAARLACEKMGLRPEAASDLEMLDMESIQIETTSTGKINVLGSDKFAERLKALKPHWFSDKNKPNVNTNGTRVNDSAGDVTVEDVMAAEREGRKTGDLSKYHEVHKKFQQQKAASRLSR